MNGALPKPSQLKVLIADDEEDHITLLGLNLRGTACDIHSATTPEDCLRMYSALRPDLVFLDVDMGFPGGFVTAGKLREAARKAKHDVKIIMYTARKQRDDVQRAQKMGADDYLVKPVSREALMEKLRALFPGRL